MREGSLPAPWRSIEIKGSSSRRVPTPAPTKLQKISCFCPSISITPLGAELSAQAVASSNRAHTHCLLLGSWAARKGCQSRRI